MAASVVGRDAELAALSTFLAGIHHGARALVLEGDAGMGKTTLWRAALAAAEERDVRVLRAAPSESETELSFSGLGDLLGGVLVDAFSALPAGQRRALSGALVLADEIEPAPDPHAVGVALLNVLRTLTGAAEVVLAIDDVQWLDVATAAALTYAVRRLDEEPVGIVLARRSGLVSPLLDGLRRTFPADRFSEVVLGPLELQALHQVVREHLGAILPRPLLAEVGQSSGGNPFFALEIVRMLQRSNTAIEAGQPIPVPHSLHALVQDRLLDLPPESRAFLLAAAAHAHPTIAAAEAASEVGREIGLQPALDAGIVEVERDRIRFTHPLLAAGAYETAGPLHRLEVHARLAELLVDPEARAWQLAAATERPDEGVAEALEAAARHARARGAPRPAALLLDRARQLTPADEPGRAFERAIEAASLHFESGDSKRGEAQLGDLVAQLPAGPTRARALVRLARIRSYESQEKAVEVYLQASAEAEEDPETLVAAHEGVAACLFRLRERLPEAVAHAVTAERLAESLGDEPLAAEAAGTLLAAQTLLGLESASETAERAFARQAACRERRVLAQPLFTLAVHWWWTDRVARARDALLELLDSVHDLGDESSRPYVLVLLGRVECQLGDYASAAERSREGQESAAQSGQDSLFAYNLALEALVAAHTGDVERAREAAGRALELVPGAGSRPAEHVARDALAQLALARGSVEAVVSWLEPAVAFVRREGLREPGASRFVADEVEALVGLGRAAEAEELLGWFEGNARRLGRASALANSARCRGLLAAEGGAVVDALAAFEEALEWHERVMLPLDRGRTLLALGATQRRLKRRREARATLEEALGVFEGMGAALWAERARAELKRISGRAATPGALTPAEERVAALVAEGKTNKEVAAALFLSDRTVEGHLAHVFAKLGIRHRAELAGALQTQGITRPNPGDSPVSAESSAS